MDITIENAADALANRDTLTEEHARAFRALLYERRVDLDKQLDAIVDPNEGGNDQWNRVLATGTDEDLAELEREYDGLKRDRDRFQAQYNQFANLAVACRQREAESTIPNRTADLEAKADDVIAARDALEAACGRLEAAFQNASAAYRDATRGAMAEVDGADEALVDKVCTVAKGAAYTPKGPLYQFAETRPHVIRAVTGYSETLLLPRSISDRIGLSAKWVFHSLGVNSATRLAGWRATRWSTSTR